MQAQPDSVVCNAALGEVIGADPLAPVPCADHALAVLRLGAALLSAIVIVEPRAQYPICLFLIFQLAALVLTCHDDARRKMRQSDRRFRLVDLLSARARGTE